MDGKDGSISWETSLLHADGIDEGIAPPIHQTVPFPAGTPDEFDLMSRTPRHSSFYRRNGGPTQARLEEVMAAAEGAEAGLATASGMAAISTALLSLAAGGHVVAQRSMYGGTLGLLQEVAPGLGIEVTLVDQTATAAFEEAIGPDTRLIMIETPSNPLLRLTDVAGVAALARDRGIRTLADNTIATPVNHRPLEQGIDLVVHSLTKWVSGHSDVLAGIVLGSGDLIERIWRTHMVLGGVVGPFDAWLALRGLRTLPLRVERQNRTALAVARFLEGHPAVAAVHHPGLPGHRQHDLARRQMRGAGGVLSFEVRGGAAAAEAMIAALRLPARSPSLGGVRSLVVRPDAMWARELTPEQRAAAGVAPGLVRLAVGLEAADDLVTDLDRALAGAAPPGAG